MKALAPIFFALLIAISISCAAAYAEPIWSEATESVLANYSSSFAFEFNVTWQNATAANITIYKAADPAQILFSGDMTNESDNYTYSAVMPAGDWEWISYADNETGDSNSTTPRTFSIGKADNEIVMIINNGTETLNSNVTITYGTPVTVTCLSSAGCEIYREGVNVSDEIGNSTVLSARVYNYTAVSAGNDNYTSNATTHYIEVLKSDYPVSLFLNCNETNSTYHLNQTANFTAYMEGHTVNLSSDYEGFEAVNKTNFILDKSGYYYINATFEGNENYTANFTTLHFNVTPWSNAATSIPGPATYTKGQSYNFSVMWHNSTPISNAYFVWKGTIRNATENSTIDSNRTLFTLTMSELPYNETAYTYYLFVNYTDGTNATSEIFSYNVNQRPAALVWLSPTNSYSGASWSYTAGTSGIIVRCNTTDSVNLSMTVTSGTATSTLYSTTSGSIQDTPSSDTAATYTYSCNPNNANYSGSATATLFFIGSVTTTTTSSSSSSSSGSSSSGSFLIKDMASELSVEVGKSATATFVLSNTLANNIANVGISLTGIDAGWYTLSTKNISVLQKTIPQTVMVTFNIPATAQAKTYDVTVVASGKMLGESSTRSTTKTMKLIVTGQPAIAPLDITGTPEDLPEQTSAEASINKSAQSNETSIFGPTGLASTFEYLQGNMVFILGAASCILIFIFRNSITDMMVGFAPNSETRAARSKKAAKMPSVSIPSLNLKDKLNYKLSINLEKSNSPANAAKIEDAARSRRPEVLEREIQRDLKELKNVLENEKRMERKKGKIENN